MKYNDNGTAKDIVIKAGDTLPVGTVVSYDGETIPSGWEQVTDIEEIVNEQSTSKEQAYSCDYMNKVHTYSDKEQLVGNWFEYKLYRKVVMFGALPNNASKSVAHGISDLGAIVNIEGRASNGTNFFPLPYISSNAAQGISYFVDKTNITITTGSDRSDYSGFITLYYTKTTN